MKNQCGRRGLAEALVSAMYSDYQAGLSLAEVGEKYGRTRQSIFGVFEKRGFALRARVLLPALEFDGQKYTCQKTCGRHRYLRNTVRGRAQGDRTVYLHQVIWEKAHGPIPAGHKLAFRDGNHLNVALENLELLINSEQVRKYAAKGHNQFTVTAAGRLRTLIEKHAGGRSLASALKGRSA